MPTYIGLARMTQKGRESIKDSPTRLQKAKDAIKAAGGKLVGFYMTMGQYDFVTVIEAPNDEAVAKVVLASSGMGTIQFETLRAFTEDEYRKILTGLP